MNWIGLIITLLAGIIGIGLSREWIRKEFPKVGETHLDQILLVLLAIGLVISSIEYLKESKNLKQVEDEQKGRTLTPKQEKYLRETFSRLPKTSVYLMGIQGDREAIRFANTLKEILIVAGWEVDGVWEENIIGGAGPGILVRQGPSTSDSLGQRITDSLNKMQITARLVIMPDFEPHQLEIIVGSRP